MKSIISYIIFLTCLSSFALGASNQKNIIDIADYVQSDGFAEVRTIPNTHDRYIGGMGSIKYQFNIPTDGWYSILMKSAPWAVDIIIDEKLITHTTLVDFRRTSKGATKFKLNNIVNVFLEKGDHTIAFNHNWATGLPWIRNIIVQRTDRPEDSVSVELVQNRAVYRLNESAPIKLLVSRHSYPYTINIAVSDEDSSEIISNSAVTTVKGVGNQEFSYLLPTSKSGVYKVSLVDNINNKVTRPFQYVVIDNIKPPKGKGHKELVNTIEVTEQLPDYSSSDTKTVNSALGAYRESEGIGYYNDRKPDYFAYNLNLLERDQLYMAEIFFPDDKNRTFTASVIDSQVNPYSIDAGVMTGREFPLSNSERKLQIYFYSKDIQQKLLFLNWHSGEKIAIKMIKIYRIDSLNQEIVSIEKPRRNAMYFEEPMRFTTYFGSDTDVKDWKNIEKAAARWAQWSRSNYINHWVVTVAAYQGRMYPTVLLPGFAPGDSWSPGMFGRFSNKDIIEKDILWLLLLVAEKYDIKVTFELQLASNKTMLKYLVNQWQSNAGAINDAHIIVSKNGEKGSLGPDKPYFNPVNPDVQKWVESIFGELADRYHVLPAFDGVSIRFMKWAFSGWQTFSSLDWGYGDHTINMFVKETKIVIPVTTTGDDRYIKRYTWLMNNAYADWVEWRSKVIHQYHSRLENILISKRADLNLYLDIFDPTYANVEKINKDKASNLNHIRNEVEYDRKGWGELLKEAGLDTKKYSDNHNTVMVPVSKYPPGIRINKIGPFAEYRIASMMDGAVDKEKIISTLNSDGVGYESSIMFYNEYMEASFDTHNIDLDLLRNKNKKRSDLSICGVLNPAGRNMLARYANALAEGNITYLVDGGLGYTLGQPHITKEFMREYMSIPAISMSRHSDTGDAVALWYGSDLSDSFFYIVNRADYSVQVNITLSKNSKVRHLTTGKVYSGAILNLSLKPYEILSFQYDNDGAKIENVDTNYPANVSIDLKKQISQARNSIDSLKASQHNKKYKAEIQVAESELNDVQKKYNTKQYLKARRGLMSRHLVRIYSVQHSGKTRYPEGLWYH